MKDESSEKTNSVFCNGLKKYDTMLINYFYYTYTHITFYITK